MEFVIPTGETRYRQTIFGKLVLQIQEKGNSYDCRGGGSYSPDQYRWRDATVSDLNFEVKK